MAAGNSGIKLQLALTPNQIIQDNTVKNCAEGLKAAIWLVWRTLVQYGDDYGVRKLAQEFHPEGKAVFMDYEAFDDMNFNDRKMIHIDLALGMMSDENQLQRQQAIIQGQTQLYQTTQQLVASGTLTPEMFKKIRKPYEDSLFALGIKSPDAYLPTEEEVVTMIKQAQDQKKQQGPSPQEQVLTAQAQGIAAKAQLDQAKAAEIQADVQGTSAGKQLEGVALIGEHKATAYRWTK